MATNGTNDNVPLALIGSTTLLGVIGTATGVIGDANTLFVLIGAQLVGLGFTLGKRIFG